MPHDKRYFLIFFLLFGIGLLAVFLLQKPQRILIVSPHPDDAVLCCAGVIQQAVKRGDTVHIIEITDGTGYQAAAASASGKPVGQLKPEDYLALGTLRRNEDLTALSILGLSEKNVTFLGYPDGWLDETYKADAFLPFTDPYTKQAASKDTKHVFAKSSVVGDLTSLLTTLRPDILYLPSDSDDSLDHTVTTQFVKYALQNTDYSPKLRTYLVHSQNFEGFAASSSAKILLSATELTKKRNAIEAFRTQTVLDGEYLRSFVSTEEVFNENTPLLVGTPGR